MWYETLSKSLLSRQPWKTLDQYLQRGVHDALEMCFGCPAGGTSAGRVTPAKGGPSSGWGKIEMLLSELLLLTQGKSSFYHSTEWVVVQTQNGCLWTVSAVVRELLLKSSRAEEIKWLHPERDAKRIPLTWQAQLCLPPASSLLREPLIKEAQKWLILK